MQKSNVHFNQFSSHISSFLDFFLFIELLAYSEIVADTFGIKKATFMNFLVFDFDDQSLIFSYFKFLNNSSLTPIAFNGFENSLFEKFEKFPKK